MEIITLADLVEYSANLYRGQAAFQIRQEDGQYRRITFQQVQAQITQVQSALAGLKVKAGDRVALISENRPEWPVAYLAITGMGGVAVPLDAQLNPEEINLLLDDAGVKVIILSDKFAAYAPGREQIVMGRIADLPAPAPLPDNPVSSDDLAAIVYTSGTTGVPKGVMLTHRNLMSNVAAVASLFDLGPKDNFLSVLPLHHTFETTAGFLGPFYMGCTVTYAESLKSHNILRNMRETGVTVMCGVPLLFQLFYDGIMREVEERGLAKAFSVLFGLARFFQNIIGLNLGRKLFKTVHEKFGGKIRFFVSGGAALDPALAGSFQLMGFTILQGYGLTESAPILTCNNLKHNRLGSVGRPIPGVEIKIAGTDPVGEILAFGPNIMKGYYKRRELSSRMLINGWLYTGDVGYLDDDNFLFITGRSKDVIVTAAGVNVYPDEIEFTLNKVPGVKESCVLGDKVKEGARKGTEEVIALIVPDYEYLARQNITTDDQVQTAINREVRGLNQRLADFKRIARFIIRKEELPKTRLKKIKRFAIKKEVEL